MKCSFCRQPEHAVYMLIIGQGGCICAACVDAVADIVRERRRTDAEREYRSWFGGRG